MTRYDTLLELIDKYKPRSIVEIGVWNGANAIRMINRAKQYHPDVEYTGYDLFQDATPETDQKEFNVKGHNTAKAVSAYIRSETGITPNLIRGNTLDTLRYEKVDFVFLDGGHSVGTIAHDYAAVKDSKVIVLDDYYTDGVDTSKYGCNKLVWEFNRPYQILPHKDPVKGGGFCQLVVVEA